MPLVKLNNVPTEYLINEIFESVQGEGAFTGIAATFVRLQGCDVGCPWCDTKKSWSSKGVRIAEGSVEPVPAGSGAWLNLDALQDAVKKCWPELVVITGGEPMMWNLDPLLEIVRRANKISAVETSGHGADGIWYGRDWPNHLTWSPKRNLNFEAPHSVREHASEVKIVIDKQSTWSEVESVIYSYLPNCTHFVLMPEYTKSGGMTENISKALDFQHRSKDFPRPVMVLGRLQIEWGLK